MLEILQIVYLAIIALLGIPAGMFIARYTPEELKPGRRWFKLIAIASLVAFVVSLFAVKGDNLALVLTTLAFIFFLSVVPIIRMK